MKTKITREDLRRLGPGEEIYVELPGYSAVLSARATATQLGKIEEKYFTTRQGERSNSLYIRREQ